MKKKQQHDTITSSTREQMQILLYAIESFRIKGINIPEEQALATLKRLKLQ